MRNKKDLQKLLNLNYTELTNTTVCSGFYDLPKIYCDPLEIPDYIALYSQPCEYHKTSLTAVGFYDYDIKFDGKNGLYNAIYYKDEKQLEKFKRRFQGIKYFISPDYTRAGDAPFYHNIYRLGVSREVAIWLSINLRSIVIPNMPCCSEEDLSFFCDGLEDVTMVAFSTKGRTHHPKDKELLSKSVEASIHKLKKLKTILVYDVSADNKYVDELFATARNKRINVIVPDNILKRRNRTRYDNV